MSDINTPFWVQELEGIIKGRMKSIYPQLVGHVREGVTSLLLREFVDKGATLTCDSRFDNVKREHIMTFKVVIKEHV